MYRKTFCCTGDLVGDREGLLVDGDLDGERDGDFVGEREGLLVVGELVGDLLGPMDGGDGGGVGRVESMPHAQRYQNPWLHVVVVV